MSACVCIYTFYEHFQPTVGTNSMCFIFDCCSCSMYKNGINMLHMQAPMLKTMRNLTEKKPRTRKNWNYMKFSFFMLFVSSNPRALICGLFFSLKIRSLVRYMATHGKYMVFRSRKNHCTEQDRIWQENDKHSRENTNNAM